MEGKGFSHNPVILAFRPSGRKAPHYAIAPTVSRASTTRRQTSPRRPDGEPHRRIGVPGAIARDNLVTPAQTNLFTARHAIDRSRISPDAFSRPRASASRVSAANGLMRT